LNNVSPGDGQGRLHVLDAATGTVIRTINTGVGDTSTPSGLVGLRAWVDNADADNTAKRVYGGDNLGNVWRFDVNGNVGAAGYDAQLLATLRNTAGDAQPITARPELGAIASASGEIAMVYVGTGRYLGITDLTNSSTQTIYAIKDALGTTSLGNPRTAGNGFVAQTLTATTCPTGSSVCTTGQSVRTGTNNAVDMLTGNGWYVDLPLPRERANTDPQLVLGTLVFTTNVPSSTACTVGGTSYINFFDYRTGAPVNVDGTISDGVASVLLGDAIATRPTVVKLPNGKVISLTRLSNDTTAINEVPVQLPPGSTRRVLWRELTN
jgi:type IV pilus assembly protein PilY1